MSGYQASLQDGLGNPVVESRTAQRLAADLAPGSIVDPTSPDGGFGVWLIVVPALIADALRQDGIVVLVNANGQMEIEQ